MYEDWLINYLSKYNHIASGLEGCSKPKQVRALMNITMPDSLSDEFYQKQDAFLRSELKKKEIVDASAFPYANGIALYQGDITAIRADAIVNACNPQLLGCFVMLHGCIDNAIHSAAGFEVRRDLEKVMESQGHEEPNGQVKVTKGYNLPASYIFHTVGPIANGHPSHQDEKDLASCYLSCLKKADEMGLSTIVFCSLSTGVYGYPIEEASKIAISTVAGYLQESKSSLKVAFDVFSERDYQIYERQLSSNQRNP